MKGTAFQEPFFSPSNIVTSQQRREIFFLTFVARGDGSARFNSSQKMEKWETRQKKGKEETKKEKKEGEC